MNFCNSIVRSSEVSHEIVTISRLLFAGLESHLDALEIDEAVDCIELKIQLLDESVVGAGYSIYEEHPNICEIKKQKINSVVTLKYNSFGIITKYTVGRLATFGFKLAILQIPSKALSWRSKVKIINSMISFFESEGIVTGNAEESDLFEFSEQRNFVFLNSEDIKLIIIRWPINQCNDHKNPSGVEISDVYGAMESEARGVFVYDGYDLNGEWMYIYLYTEDINESLDLLMGMKHNNKIPPGGAIFVEDELSGTYYDIQSNPRRSIELS